jgi:hypothetical protein
MLMPLIVFGVEWNALARPVERGNRIVILKIELAKLEWSGPSHKGGPMKSAVAVRASTSDTMSSSYGRATRSDER